MGLVIYSCSSGMKKEYRGSLHLLAYQIMFSFSLSSNSPSESTKSPQQSSSSSSELWIPYSNILQLERKLTLVRPTLEISTRDFLCVHLMFKNELEIRDVYLSIQSILASYTPDNVQQQYAFNYHPVLPYSFDGWKLYDPISEYDRLGVGSPGNAWRLSSSNSSYAVRNISSVQNSTKFTYPTNPHSVDIANLSSSFGCS